MRALLFFDLPMITDDDRKIYTHFRKDIMKLGFFMIQNSVYAKLALDSQALEFVINKVKKLAPPTGNVVILKVTEKQFEKMDFLIGEKPSSYIDTTEKTIIL